MSLRRNEESLITTSNIIMSYSLELYNVKQQQ